MIRNDPNSHGIRIDVETLYLKEQSLPSENRYVFAYTITIRNEGQSAAKLLARHWVITDGEGEVQEVRGSGVIGEQPHLEPGESFRYTSGTVLATPVGSMHGSYEMIDDGGERFDAQIPAFTLSRPHMLH